MIFVTLARRSVRLDQLGPAFVMLGLEITCIALAWVVSVWMGLKRAQQGAVVFCSAFGSSTFLGYPIIMAMFPHKTAALTEAVLISEIGVGYPIFILGPLLAMYFGSEGSDSGFDWSASLAFFRSPVFFALVLGILWGCLKLPGQDNFYLAPLFQVCHVLAAALTPLAILSVGLMFRIPSMRSIFFALALVIVLKLLFKPILAGLCAFLFGFPKLWRDVLVLLAAMPPAILGAVFLKRYGGDASLASTLLLAASLVSSVTLLFVFWLVG